MKLTINKKTYQTRGITGLIGGILMIPGIVAMLVVVMVLMVIVIPLMLCMAPGLAIAKIGAVRTPHLDEPEEVRK